MLGSKEILILQNLMEMKFTLKELAEKLSINERGIRYQIEKINEYYMDNYNEKELIYLSKGNLEVTNKSALREIIEKNYNVKNFSSEDRERFILYMILKNREINQTKMCEELDISRNTIKQHLKVLKDKLKRFHLKLELNHKKGLILEGKEEDIRICLLNEIRTKKSNSIWIKKIESEYIDVKIEGIKKYINYCQKLMNKVISDEAYMIISLYIQISVAMLKKGNSIKKISNEKFLEDTEEYKIIKKAGILLEAEYDIEIPKVEYLKFTDYFLGSHTYNSKYSYYENWIEIEILIKKMIKGFNKRIDVDILKDTMLLEGLLNHLKPTIYRIQKGIVLENSIYLDVKESYPHLFKITEEVVSELELYIGEKMSKDEIAFITVYFKAAIDRNRVTSKNKKKIIIVCGMGYGTSKLLAQHLRELYSIEIVDIIPKYLLDKVLNEQEVEAVITTVDIEKDYNIPIIKVNPIFTPDDMKKLKNYDFQKRSKKILLSDMLKIIEKRCEIKDREYLIGDLKELLNGNLVDDILIKKITIFDMLEKNRIKIGEVVRDWEEGIRKAGESLIKDGYIDSTYIDDIIECVKEFGSYMVLGKNTAFPHAINNGNVMKTGFSILNLRKAVLFPGDIAVKNIIVFSSVDSKEHLDGFLELMEYMDNDEFNIDKFVKNF